jgi:DNA-binding transcriptional MerR regulator
MGTEIDYAKLPIDLRTGLTLPLSRSLASPDLAKHRAMVAVELEVMAKKFDRFGWERDRGSHAHDRMLLDWMDALQDFTLEEVKQACRDAVQSNPNKMPNEGHVVAEIMNRRKRDAQEWIALGRVETAPAIERPDPEAKKRTADFVAKMFPEIGRKWDEYQNSMAKE